jgi:hypothetical protein
LRRYEFRRSVGKNRKIKSVISKRETKSEEIIKTIEKLLKKEANLG